MPHAVVEWTDNLEEDGFHIRPLLEVVAARLRDSGGVFPVGGVRVRAVRLVDYVIADDAGGDAFININVKIGAGRSPEFRKGFFDALFAAVEAHLGDLFDRRPLALSLYVEEADEAGSYKHNTIHRRLKSQQAVAAS